MKKKMTGIFAAIAIIAVVVVGAVFLIDGIGIFTSRLNDIKGQLVGNSFECQFYDNYGERFLTVSGNKIGLTGNIVKEAQIDSEDGTAVAAYSLSSIVTINVDGNQMQSCGDTIIFEEEGLEPDVNFQLEDINSDSNGIMSNTAISGIVNKYKNMFGNGQVVVIQSQLGVPICAYSGNNVYWEVREDLPKTTKLMIDGKALYIHRANFQIIDKALID